MQSSRILLALNGYINFGHPTVTNFLMFKSFSIVTLVSFSVNVLSNAGLICFHNSFKLNVYLVIECYCVKVNIPHLLMERLLVFVEFLFYQFCVLRER